MSRGHGIRKINEVIMKKDAQADYESVKAVCQRLNLPIVTPKGQSAWKIEDATAVMIKTVPPETKIVLLKGISYYLSL